MVPLTKSDIALFLRGPNSTGDGRIRLTSRRHVALARAFRVLRRISRFRDGSSPWDVLGAGNL